MFIPFPILWYYISILLRPGLVYQPVTSIHSYLRNIYQSENQYFTLMIKLFIQYYS